MRNERFGDVGDDSMYTCQSNEASTVVGNFSVSMEPLVTFQIGQYALASTYFGVRHAAAEDQESVLQDAHNAAAPQYPRLQLRKLSQ